MWLSLHLANIIHLLPNSDSVQVLQLVLLILCHLMIIQIDFCILVLIIAGHHRFISLHLLLIVIPSFQY
jgi:hypothetical protein